MSSSHVPLNRSERMSKMFLNLHGTKSVLIVEQMKLVCPDYVDSDWGVYLKAVSEAVVDYEELCKEFRVMPETLKQLGIIN